MDHIIDNAALRGVSLCFLSIRSKTNTRSVAFLEYHIYHRPVRPVKTDSANVEKMNLSSPPGQIFFFLVSSKPNRQLCNLLRRKNGTPQLLWPPAVLRRRLRCRAKYKDRGSCRSWATSLNLPSLFGCKRILHSLPYNDSQHSFLLVKP